MNATTSRRMDDSTSGMVALGVTGFAGVMLATVAVFQILAGIAAIGNDEVFVVGDEYVYALDITAWGWLHLGLGILGLATGIGILGGAGWARMLGIALAVLGSIAAFAFIPYYPWWSLAILAFNVLVIWALATQISRGTTL